MADSPRVEVVQDPARLPPAEWDRLAGAQPFLRHAFLAALHETGCACAASGWAPLFLALWRDGRLAGAVPLWLKSHSWGEYVFDWAWADAYRRHGLAYYPKLLAAVPFTPVTGPRLLAETAEDRALLLQAALELARDTEASSLHLLFPTPREAEELQDAGMLMRSGVQFRWVNQGYPDFDAFLAAMNHDKRKKIRQERRRLAQAGIAFHHLRGGELDDAHWAFFHDCYRDTYRRHRSTPYLNLDFFRALGERMPESVVMILAERAGRPVAAALDLTDGSALYGRYWGAAEHWPGLHFEVCYHQAIEFCIAHGLCSFEGGAQGEHKLARGLTPVRTCSAHWLAHPEFSRAVEDYLAHEASGIDGYLDELEERTPFRRAG